VPLLERFKYPIFALLAVALLAGIAVLLWHRPEPTTIAVIPPQPTLIPSPTPLPSITPTPGPYMVYVSGAVASPEALVTLDYGSRVYDALAAAGGALDNADLERVNLAQVLHDGDQVQVPTVKPGKAETIVQVVTATPGNNTVYVTGEVAYPGILVTLPAGSVVQDAIDAAGGPTDHADLSGINLARRLNDGEQVHVPSLIEDDNIQTATPNSPTLVHVNTATQEELETLPEIGPATAQAIIQYRTEHGPFNSLEDLDQVPGIGPATLDKIRDYVAFD
jgi:comEA protein